MKTQRPRGGRIINNGSISATTPRPEWSPTLPPKHAISGLTKTTALEGREHDIACGQIDIGNTATALATPMAHGTLQPDMSLKSEPTFDVKYVADAVVYMAGLPLRGQRVVYDGDGDEDAVCRAGVTAAVIKRATAAGSAEDRRELKSGTALSRPTHPC